MEIHAYEEIYVSKIQMRMGEAFDYAINILKINGNIFVDYFLNSSVNRKLEKGYVLYFLGKSGIEIALDIIDEITGRRDLLLCEESMIRSAEYWIGWAITYYQWYTNKPFRRIFENVKFSELEKMYYTLHEADITKFVDAINSIINKGNNDTNLKRIRNAYGISQKELSIKSGVSVRSIQMYEQRNKDINKANSITLYMLSRVLGCNMEDLLEF